MFAKKSTLFIGLCLALSAQAKTIGESISQNVLYYSNGQNVRQENFADNHQPWQEDGNTPAEYGLMDGHMTNQQKWTIYDKNLSSIYHETNQIESLTLQNNAHIKSINQDINQLNQSINSTTSHLAQGVKQFDDHIAQQRADFNHQVQQARQQNKAMAQNNNQLVQQLHQEVKQANTTVNNGVHQAYSYADKAVTAANRTYDHAKYAAEQAAKAASSVMTNHQPVLGAGISLSI